MITSLFLPISKKCHIIYAEVQISDLLQIPSFYSFRDIIRKIPKFREGIVIPKYIQIEGTTQGKFGGSLMHNHQPAIELISFSHKLKVPVDVNTQLPIANRVHDAIRVVKKIDRTTVKFYAALTTNEVIKSAVISIVDTVDPWVVSNNFTISLGESFISEINQINSPVLYASSTPINFVEYEEIALNYQTITWEFGNASANDKMYPI